MKLVSLLGLMISHTILVDTFCRDIAFSAYNFNDNATSYFTYNNEQGGFELQSLESRPIKTPQFSKSNI